MRILTRYIAREIIIAIGLISLVLMAIESFIELINELQDIGTGNYGVMQAFIYVPLMLPRDIYQLFPIAGLLGALIGLSRLAKGSELVVMRASGFSSLQILFAVAKIALILLVLVTVLGEYVAPRAQKFATTYKRQAESSAASPILTPGVWLHHDENYIHIKQVDSDRKVSGVTIYDFASGKMNRLINAAYASKQADGWQLYQVGITRFHADQISLTQQAKLNWDLKVNPMLLVLQQEDTSKMSVWTLYKASHALKAAGLQANQIEFAFWKRLLQPAATLIMILLAIPAILGPLRELTIAARLLIGIVVGFCFYTLNQFFGPFSMVYQMPPYWAAALPVILFAVIGLILFWRIR